MGVSSSQRWSKAHPCPICGGTKAGRRGGDGHCHGYVDESGKYARCSSYQHAGSLSADENALFVHYLGDSCRCGDRHSNGTGTPRANERAPLGRVVAEYEYTDAEGTYLYTVRRYEPKTFRQGRYAGGAQGQGELLWGLDGVQPVLYQLPDVLEALGMGNVIHLVEGEKDVHAIEKAGGVATCNPMGAGKWRDAYSEALRGATVHLIQDKDGPEKNFAGQKHAKHVKASLEAHGCTVTLLESRAGKDAADHLAAGHGLDDFVAATEWEPPEDKLPNERPRVAVTWFTDVRTKRLDWLWYPRLLANAPNFVSGDPGCGKSYACQAIAAALTAGRPFFNTNGDSTPTPGTVLYLYAEGAIDSVILPRMQLMDVDPARICASTGRGVDPNDYVSLDRKDLFDELIQKVAPKLLILDPIESFMGNCNPNAADDVRPRLDYLADVCANHHVTAVGIRFDRKAAADFAIHKSAGSIAWMAAGRSFLGCTEDPERPNVTTPGEIVTYGILSHIKVNDAPKGASLRYAIHDTPQGIGRFEWTDTTHLTANDLLTPRKRQAQADSESALERGKNFLLAALAKGARDSGELIQEAKERGICSRATLFTAKKELGLRARKKGFSDGWEWEISEIDLPEKYQGVDFEALLTAEELKTWERPWWAGGAEEMDGRPYLSMAALEAWRAENCPSMRDADVERMIDALTAAGKIEAAREGWLLLDEDLAANLLRCKEQGEDPL